VSRSRTMAGLLAGLVTMVIAVATPAAQATSTPSPPDRVRLSAAEKALLDRQARSAAELDKQLELQLKLAPGGKRTARNEITYNGGKFVVTYALPGTSTVAGVPDCPSGWFCFYEHTNYGYPRGKLSDCGWQNLWQYGWDDRISSVHNRTSTTVEYWEDDPVDWFLFDNWAYEGRPQVPYSNMADFVIRLC
jgi:peptidase inhibitor family I36